MKTRSSVYQIEKEMPWQDAGPGIKRQIMAYDGQLMMVKVQFETGAIGTPHTHYHSQATYVASGRFMLTIGESRRELGPGDGYYVEPDICTDANAWRQAYSSTPSVPCARTSCE